MDIGKAAEFVKSYGAAGASGSAEAAADHYGWPYTSFTLGHTSQFADRVSALAQMKPWFARFKEFGIDDMRLARTSIHTVSDTFALCHVTWEIHPKSADVAPWQWTNIYGLRQDEHGQRFEFAVSDNEIANLLQRFPNFLQG
jgi:hypothetical protein